MPGSVLGPTQSPVQWMPGARPQGVKRPWRETDHSLLVSKLRIVGAMPPLPFCAFIAQGQLCSLPLPSKTWLVYHLRNSRECRLAMTVATLLYKGLYICNSCSNGLGICFRKTPHVTWNICVLLFKLRNVRATIGFYSFFFQLVRVFPITLYFTLVSCPVGKRRGLPNVFYADLLVVLIVRTATYTNVIILNAFFVMWNSGFSPRTSRAQL